MGEGAARRGSAVAAGPTGQGGTGGRDVWRGVWRLADPKISLASMASILLGACLAAADGVLHAGWLAVTAAGVFAVEVAKNASGEIHDWDQGVDQGVRDAERTPFSGGKRVLVEGLLTRGQTRAVAAAGYLACTAAGLALVLHRSPAVLALGAVGVACAWFYHAPPLRLAYRGWGEAAVALCYGPLVAGGTYLVQHGRLTPEVAAAGVPMGLLVAGFLVANEVPDRRADREAGKRTLVVRLGLDGAARLYAGLAAAAAVATAALPSAGVPAGVLAGEVAVLPAAWAALRLRDVAASGPPVRGEEVVPAQAAALVALLAFAAAAGAGVLA